MRIEVEVENLKLVPIVYDVWFSYLFVCCGITPQEQQAVQAMRLPHAMQAMHSLGLDCDVPPRASFRCPRSVPRTLLVRRPGSPLIKGTLPDGIAP